MITSERRNSRRRYLLGISTAENRAAIEVGYFEFPASLDLVCEAEDDLIDDYLSGRLASDERDAFESYYLATPHHRTRVAVARRLRSAAATVAREDRRQPASERTPWLATFLWSPAWAAGAGALVLVAASAVWIIRTGSAPPTADPNTPTATGSDRTPSTSRSKVPRPPDSSETAPGAGTSRLQVQPVVIALSIAPTSVRGADTPATLTIPPSTDLVVLRLQGEVNEAPLNSGRAIVRTVSGDEVWRGPAGRGDQIGILARIEMPSRLQPEDYIVELFDRDARGRDLERQRYFFRIRGDGRRN